MNTELEEHKTKLPRSSFWDMKELLRRHGCEARGGSRGVVLLLGEKRTGPLAAALGGLDTFVFAGDIGEHSPEMRACICAGLGFLGIELIARPVCRALEPGLTV
jgi:acetate kinase